MLNRFKELAYPGKCVFCRCLLEDHQTDLCAQCRQDAPVHPGGKFKLSFIARWTAVWYYKDAARRSIMRYKFGSRPHYAPFFGRQLAMRIRNDRLDDFDVLTYVPASLLRKLRRRFQQVRYLAEHVARELGVSVVPVLKKTRHTQPQHRLRTADQRRANILGAFRVTDPEQIRGKRVLLIDDILTTGATASECARVLLTAGAAEVTVACLAAAAHNETKEKPSPRKDLCR